MALAGRTPLSKLEKAKRKASRDYRKIFEKRALSYDDIYEKRAGNKNMGRKPIPKHVQIERAKDEFLNSLSKHRAEALEASIELPGIKSLLREYKIYRANDSAGRKSGDRVIILCKYIDKETIKLEKAENSPCPMETYNGRGRKPMSKLEKIEHYQNKISDATNEIAQLMETAPRSQQIYYDLRQERLDVRRLKQLIAINPDHGHAQDQLIQHEQKVIEFEKEYNNQLLIEKKDNKSNLATSVSNVTSTLPNPNFINESIATAIDKVVVPTNVSEHETIELLKDKQVEINKELKALDELEEIVRERYLLLKKNREIQETIESKQNKLIN